MKSFGYFILIAVFWSFSGAVLYAQESVQPPNGSAVTAADVSRVIQIDNVKIKQLLKPNGKPLLVNFWATWCVPCREEFPDLVKIDEDYRGKIDFIAITLDDLAEINRDVPKFLSQMKASMPAYLLYTDDENAVIGSISKTWEGGLPFTLLYDAKGVIVHSKQGKIKPQTVRETIDRLIRDDYEVKPTKEARID